MCGIAGILTDRGRTPERQSLERMVGALAHRGPDGSGMHIEPGVGLGHTRLSIIDVDGGAQPIHNETSSIWITYNGEIFNYVELRKDLETRGHRFYTHTDTEVIVHLYEERGERFVDELNGQFAFAIWDRNRRRLILARDRAGILPLFYSFTNHGLVFASEVKSLLASGYVPAAVDPDGLDEAMTFWAPVAPRTVFKGVSQLCPGEMLVADEQQSVRRVRYWSWSFPRKGEHRRADESILRDELAGILGDATEIRLRADVPVGAYLSGGLDSSSLVALLKQRVPETLRTFSIGFDQGDLDETKYQQQIVRELSTAHQHVQCSNQDVANVFPRTILHAETPVLRAAPAPMQILSGVVRQSDVRVVLTGEGADEVLGGYDIFKEAKVRHFWARQPQSRWRPTLLKRLYPYLNFTSAQSAAYLREFFGVGIGTPDDPCFSHLPRWATTAQTKLFWSNDFRSTVTGSAISRLRDTLPKMDDWEPFNRAEYLESLTLLPSYLLASQGDRMLMANSVEGRFPFLDHRLIEFANRLHPSRKMRVLREKYLLKQAMAGKLPAAILARHKQPYRAPDAASFLQAEAPEYVTELIGRDAIVRHGYFDPEKVALLVDKLRKTRAATPRDNMAFMGILSTQLWHARFIAGYALN